MSDPEQLAIWKTVQILLNKVIYADSYSCRRDSQEGRDLRSLLTATGEKESEGEQSRLSYPQVGEGAGGEVMNTVEEARPHEPPDVESLLRKAQKPSADAMRLHPFYRGKIETVPKGCIRSIDDFAIWYTPGVAAPCRAIEKNPDLVYEYTSKWNTVAVISDGTRVLGSRRHWPQGRPAGHGGQGPAL